MNSKPAPLALYVHWPWCLSKCPYCDFNSRPADPANLPEAAYLNAITAELNHYASQTNGRNLTSIYFGGGTPSLMEPQTVAQVVESASRLWGLHSDCEITLEANPTSVEVAKLRGFRAAGANRVSVGVQALNDADLRALGREHSATQALRALDIAGAVFDRFTFDLIYARPEQTLRAWEKELSQALAVGSDHLSLYQLTVEPGTEFFRRNVREADEDLAVKLFYLTQEMMQGAGLPAYEISNHARPGAHSRHNLTYWTGGDYVGIGPGAHGRIRDQGVTSATHQISDPARWLEAATKHGHGTAKVRILSAAERAAELLLTGLRLPEGVSRERFTEQSGLDIMQALDPQGLKILVDAGLVKLDDSTLCVSPEGRLTLNAILERLLV
ncbi:MAG: radical SAM family heme chaperone HemW [Rhodospirillales bacterium]|nr:radical SAM family heme chaperone HemW [Rhodospirillales bacterium]